MVHASGQVEYVEIPEEYDFSTEFDTWILAFCPDTDEWFATRQRFFYFEYPVEFPSEEEAIRYFKNDSNEFLRLEKEMGVYRPLFYENGVWLANVRELVPVLEEGCYNEE